MQVINSLFYKSNIQTFRFVWKTEARLGSR